MRFLTDHMKEDSIGARGEPFDIEIEKRLITMFLDALGDENPNWQGDESEQNGRMLAPPGLFHTLMFIDNRPELTFDLPLTNRFDGGGKWEYFEDVRSGDVVTVDTAITEIYEKEGRSGPMVFVVYETIWTNQNEIVVAKASHSIIFTRAEE